MRQLLLLIVVFAACRTPGSPHRQAAPAAIAEAAPTDPAKGTVGAPVIVGAGRQRSDARERFRQGVASVAFEVRVHPPGETDVAGFVLDRDGRRVQRACVELEGPEGTKHRAPVFTASEGDFVFTGVPPGMAKVTITVAGSAPLAGAKRIPDHHYQDPDLNVLLRALVLLPSRGRLSVPRVKRQGPMPENDGTGWAEVAPLALALEGYSAACRQALDRPTPPRPPARSRQRGD